MLRRLVLLLVLISCTVSGTQATVYRDAMQREVILADTPQRVISLVPSVTEILFALEAQERLVAVTDYCTYPPAAQELPSIGNYADPALEQILLFRPDLVIAAADMNRPALVSKLEQLNIPVFVVYPRTVGETLTTINQLGRLVDRVEAAQILTRTMEQRLDRIGRQVPAGSKPGALVCVMLEPLTVAGPDTFINDLLRLARGQNKVAEGPLRYPTWNAEALLTSNPQVIIVSAHPGQPDPVRFFQRWPQLQAVREERIETINADWLHRPGPRLVQGVEALARALHPNMPPEN